jgi:hypothetical protein
MAMAKKKASDELAAGARVRVKEGTTVPEFPEVSCAGWTGTVVEASGKKPNTKYVIEWDDATIAALPESYLKTCEAQGLFYRMACLDGGSIEPAA